ncbi:hypothetical protein Tco_1078272 [Tanacetum coccineum]
MQRGRSVHEKIEVFQGFPLKETTVPQDPVVLQDKCRSFYGHAPAVVDLCTKADAIAQPKYYCEMKLQGLSADIPFRPRDKHRQIEANHLEEPIGDRLAGPSFCQKRLQRHPVM